MKRVIEAIGFIIEGERTFYVKKVEAQKVAVRMERTKMIREGVGHKWYSDPIGALIDNEPLLAAVAALEYPIETDDAETCSKCGCVEGTLEWGTVGDGFDGMCPSCADKDELTTDEEED